METIAKIRRLYYVEKKGFKTIARELNMSKNTVKKIIHEDKTSQKYIRINQLLPALENFSNELVAKLEADAEQPKRRRRTAKKLYQELCALGFNGSYTTVNAFVQKWKRDHHSNRKTVFVPLEFNPGEAFQFDWSEEEIDLEGKLVRVKAAHIRLCYSRLFLIVVYRNEQLEMVMDAHDKAFQFFEGVCKKGIYDNMKTAVKKVLIGKDREYNRRFFEMTSHYLFEPVACTPSAGWEKGQVENEVNTGRRNFFTPLRHVDNLEELNKQLQRECLEWAQKMAHPQFKEKTVWEVYQDEKSDLIAYRGPFNAYKIQSTVVSSYSLVHYDTNSYSVYCNYVGEAVEIRIYSDKVLVAFKDKIIAVHARCFEKNKRIYDPWHYLAALERKPGALRNGAPFKNWKLPASLITIQKKLAEYSDGDKQFIQILLQVSKYHLDEVEIACLYALNQGTHSADFIIAYLNRPLIAQSAIPEGPLLHLKEHLNDNCCCYNQAFLSRALAYQEGPTHA